ncbi:MAG TPA: 2-oxo-4-hydroxy-4-carboxy-5-ureidoimidazoline decarboxylase [Terracidiphilus sp.]|jgi:2-oxo-4-hydroxy-4-carboxy-5-ureidoimidazoline decarboxylase|nr:2-oxo-4-hydroxy-4-carboxy-5-ureidoimidazoline decarboxylase [Terracidiphilus sp.]
MNRVLAEWNAADRQTANESMLACCGAQRWAAGMAAARPIQSIIELSETADRVWATMEEEDLREAFACHPRIGDHRTQHATAQSAAWSRQEQSAIGDARERVLAELAEGNARYEELFGFTYIVCATGKSAEEMLEILKRRLSRNKDEELREAAEQQRQILQIRLGKWLTT